MDDLIGQLWGSYRLTQLLGRGGFAEVYLGEHVRLRITAAVKILHAHLSDEGVAAFQREAQVIAELAHPHIVHVLDFDVQQGRPFLVLDYAPGGSLRQRNARGARVPAVRVVEYVRQVADALSYAHEQKLIHRDVKPENMLVGRMDEVLLSDFGIVAIAHSTSSMSTQASMGTLPYMAPEQIQGKPRPASDQYALAITVYQWLSGALPFQGSAVEIIAQHLGVPVPSLRSHVPEIEQDVDQVVLKALAKAPEERFASVRDFAVALERAVIGPLHQATISPVPLDSGEPTHASSPASAVAVFPSEQKLPTRQPSPVDRTISAPLSPAPPAVTQKNTPIPSAVPLPPVQLRLPSTPLVSRREVITGLVVGGVSVGSAALFGYLSAGSLPTISSTGTDVKYSYMLSSAVNFLSWSPDGKYLAALDASQRQVVVWTPLDGKIVTTYKSQADAFLDMLWSPDSQRIAVVMGGDVMIGTGRKVFVWNASTGKDILTYQGRAPFKNLSWSADSKFIETAEGDGQMRIWNATDGKVVHSFPWISQTTTPPEGMRGSPNGKYIAISDMLTRHSISIFQADNGRGVAEAELEGKPGWPVWFGWSADSAYIAAGGDYRAAFIQIWQASTGNSVMIYRGHSGSIDAFAWSPDGAYIASVSNGSEMPGVHVWSTKTGERIRIHHLPSVTGLDWSPDGRYIIASSSAQIVLWQAP